MPLFLFIFHIFYNKHTFIQSHSTMHLSVAIRCGLSPSPHRLKAQWKTLPVVPSRESNSGLSFSKPTRYRLSHPAPFLFVLSLTVNFVEQSLLFFFFFQRQLFAQNAQAHF
jgi:hypothetical protein